MENKEFDEIMQEITSGLTDDPKTNITYLKEQCEKYKDHLYAKEITRACGRLIFSFLSDDEKNDIADVMGKTMIGYEESLEEIRFLMYKKEYATALKLMEAMVKRYEELNFYAEDTVSEYHNFGETMEEVLYKEIYKPEKAVRKADVNYAEMYLLYGSLLYELHRHEDAIQALEKAMQWAPTSARIAFEHAENYKILGQLEQFEKCTREIFKIAFQQEDLARCYRNLGYLYTEKKQYELAICCQVFSLNFEKSDVVQSELYYISTIMGKVFTPDPDTIREYFVMNDIPYGPDRDIIRICYMYGRHFFEQKNYTAALYFLSILNMYVDNEEVQEMMEESERHLG